MNPYNARFNSNPSRRPVLPASPDDAASTASAHQSASSSAPASTEQWPGLSADIRSESRAHYQSVDQSARAIQAAFVESGFQYRNSLHPNTIIARLQAYQITAPTLLETIAIAKNPGHPLWANTPYDEETSHVVLKLLAGVLRIHGWDPVVKQALQHSNNNAQAVISRLVSSLNND